MTQTPTAAAPASTKLPPRVENIIKGAARTARKSGAIKKPDGKDNHEGGERQEATAPNVPDESTGTHLPDKQAPAIVATLWLPGVKTGRATHVYGRTGTRYTFAPATDPARKRIIIKEYASLIQFEREHLDIARNVRNPIPVCVLLGNPDLAEAAKDAVNGLIGAGLRIASGPRLKALLEIAATVSGAIEDLVAAGTIAADATVTAEQAKPVIAPQPVSEDVPIGEREQLQSPREDFGQAAPASPSAGAESDPLLGGPPGEHQTLDQARGQNEGRDTRTEPDATSNSGNNCGPASVELSEVSLMNMGWDELKALGKEKGVVHKSRREVVDGLLALPNPGRAGIQ